MVELLQNEVFENENKIRSKDLVIKQKTAELEKGSAGTI